MKEWGGYLLANEFGTSIIEDIFHRSAFKWINLCHSTTKVRAFVDFEDFLEELASVARAMSKGGSFVSSAGSARVLLCG